MKKIFLWAAGLAVVLLASEAASPAIRFSTYVGGSGSDIPTAIATGADGSVYVTGLASTDFPQTQTLPEGGSGAFVTKLSPDGATLSYSVLIGGFFPRAIAVDGTGQVYLAGHNFYNGFPLKNAIQPDIAGGFDAAVVKLNAQGNEVLLATYLGGNGDDAALAIAVEGTGAFWVGGVTSSTNFPTANQPIQGQLAGANDGFLTRFNANGALNYSTYFGGSGNSQVSGITINAQNEPIFVGRSNSPEIPLAAALQPVKGAASDAFVARMAAGGGALVFSTFWGGNGSDSASNVALDAAGNIYVVGITRSSNFPTRLAAQPNYAGDDDIFLTKLLPDGSDFVYSTFLGGFIGDSYRGYPFYFGDDDIPIEVGGLAVTPTGRVLVVGSTYGADFPLLNPLKNRSQWYALDGVATLFEADGTIGYSTYIGGNGSDTGYDVAATPDGGFVLTGLTSPGDLLPDFPTTPGAYQTRNISENIDALVVKLDTGVPPLPNDSFENPTLISSSSITLLAQTGTATKQPNEPAHNGNAGGKSVWYRWTVPTTGRAIVTTDGSNFPTLLAVYYADQGALFPPVPMNGPVDRDGYSEARFPVIAGETYHIAVDGRDGASGFLALSIATSLQPNDDFANRQLINGATATVTGSNVGATGERGASAGRHTVWWKWTPPVTGFYTLTTVGSDFNTALAVFTGSALETLQGLLFEGFYTNNLARATFRAESGTEYQIMVLGDEGEVGNIQLNVAPAVRPVNDDFVNRIRLSGRNELVTGTDFDSSFEQGERDLEVLVESPIITGRMIWWEWTSPIDGAAEITTANSTRIATTDLPGTSITVFSGDVFPTDRDAITSVADMQAPVSVYLTDVRAGTHYQIGLDAVDWHKPVQYSLRIRAIAPPRIIPGSTVIDALGKLRARVEGIDGRNYRVTSSANLKDWTLLSEFPAITGEFAFESDVGTGYRFYRVEEY